MHTFGLELVLREWEFGLENLGDVLPRFPDALQGHPALTKRGHEGNLDELQI